MKYELYNMQKILDVDMDTQVERRDMDDGPLH